MEKQPINFSFRIYAKYLIRNQGKCRQPPITVREELEFENTVCLFLPSSIFVLLLMVELCCCLSTHLRSYIILVSWSPPYYKALISNSANILS